MLTAPSSSPSVTNAEVQATRLHISPLSSTVLPMVLGSSLITVASEITFCEIPTFPENSYGFITLPASSAQALRRKLNGSIFRGVKMQVEEARTEKKRKVRIEGLGSTSKKKKATGSGQTRNRLEMDVLPAVELAEGKSVKRGWASEGKTNRRKNSRNVERKGAKEVIFRTQLPCTVGVAGEKPAKSKTKAELREFQKTTSFPSFLRDAVRRPTPRTNIFSESQGWLDDEGNIIGTGPKRSSLHAAARRHEQNVVEEELNLSSIVQIDVSSDNEKETRRESNSENTGSSSPSQSSTSHSEDDFPLGRIPLPPQRCTQMTVEMESSAPFVKSQLESFPASKYSAIPTITKSISMREIHPLEALFKRPAEPVLVNDRIRPTPINTSFAFDLDDQTHDDQELDNSTFTPGSQQIPQTPFTWQDLRQRGIRSAAPTPDTAAIGRRFDWERSPGNREDGVDQALPYSEGALSKFSAENERIGLQDEKYGSGDSGDLRADGSEEAPDQGNTHAEVGIKEQSSFEQLFYRQRGDFRRSAQARARRAHKESRQAANRSAGNTGQ